MSETNIYQKLQTAQAGMKQPAFDSENPHFHSKYASLGAVMDVVLPPLHKQGLLLTQAITHESGVITIVTSVFDGDTRADLAFYPIAYEGMTAQQIGSAITYAKRYSLSSVFARVADADDDGNAAQMAKPKRAKQSNPNKKPDVVIVDDRTNVNNRLWKAIQDYAKETGGNAREIANGLFKDRPAEEWAIEEIEDKAAEFEGAI